MEHNPSLVSSEIGNLWSCYVADSLNICMMKHFLANVDDQEIKELLEHAKSLSESHLETLTSIFEKEKMPIPHGYSYADVVEDAPRLYSDGFYLRYLQKMGRVGSHAHSMALGTSYREDVLNFFLSALNQSSQLYKRAISLLKMKGELVRSPYIPYPEKVEYIHDEHFFSGYLTLHKRPLLAVEINHLSNNIEANTIGRALIEGFAQVAEDKEVREYFQEGCRISTKLIETLEKIIRKDKTNTPFASGGIVTRSSISPFSDKLMMGAVAMLSMVSIANLGQAIAASMRTDLIGEYSSLITQIGKYASVGAKIGVENGWVEKPPQTPDRQEIQES
ncbi:DUF3231 family protein [Bacillaceae bacterium S4-13-58]